MYSLQYAMPLSEEKQRRKSFELTNLYGSDLAPVISEESCDENTQSKQTPQYRE